MSDQTTPPAPPPVDGEPDATALPPEEEKRGRGKLLAIIAAVVVLLLVAGGVVTFFATRTAHHKLITPASAGPLERDTAMEKSLSSQLKLAEQQFRGQGNGKNIKYVKIAIYKEPGSSATVGRLAFLGAKLKKDESPATWLKEGVSRLAKSNNLKVSKVSPGAGGGRALCATQASPSQTAVCAWATADTRAEVVPISGSFDAKKLAQIMRQLRKDVEQSE